MVYSSWVDFVLKLEQNYDFSFQTWSPYGLYKVFEYIADNSEQYELGNNLDSCVNENLLQIVGGLKGKMFDVLKGKDFMNVPLATKHNVMQANREASEALRNMIEPDLEVEDSSLLAYSAISVDFEWKTIFSKETKGNQTFLKKTGSVSRFKELNGNLSERLLTSSGLVIDLIQYDAGLVALEQLKQAPVASHQVMESHPHVTVESFQGTSDKADTYIREWNQQTINKDLSGLLPTILTKRSSSDAISVAQETVAKFKHDGYTAAALTSVVMTRNFSQPISKNCYHYTVNWNNMRHYCVCSDPKTEAILFITDVPAL